jgi:hypothetical protein
MDSERFDKVTFELAVKIARTVSLESHVMLLTNIDNVQQKYLLGDTCGCHGVSYVPVQKCKAGKYYDNREVQDFEWGSPDILGRFHIAIRSLPNLPHEKKCKFLQGDECDCRRHERSISGL